MPTLYQCWQALAATLSAFFYCHTHKYIHKLNSMHQIKCFVVAVRFHFFSNAKQLEVLLPYSYLQLLHFFFFYTDKSHRGHWFGLVSSPSNYLLKRQQWPSQPCFILSASHLLTETTFSPLLFVCGGSKLSSITTVTHEVSNKEIWGWAGWHSCQ